MRHFYLLFKSISIFIRIQYPREHVAQYMMNVNWINTMWSYRSSRDYCQNVYFIHFVCFAVWVNRMRWNMRAAEDVFEKKIEKKKTKKYCKTGDIRMSVRCSIIKFGVIYSLLFFFRLPVPNAIFHDHEIKQNIKKHFFFGAGHEQKLCKRIRFKILCILDVIKFCLFLMNVTSWPNQRMKQ